MARRPILPLTDKLMGNLLRPRGPGVLPEPGEIAPDFTLPYAQYGVDRSSGKPSVRYGERISLSALRGRRVVISLTRIVSDRFF
jgi:hypothetical protein